MISRYSHRTSKWIDLTKPTTDELESVINEFQIDPLLAHELLFPEEMRRVEVRNSDVHFALNAPYLVDFILGPDLVITVHYEGVPALDRFAKHMEVETILGKKFKGNARDRIFFGILGELMEGLFHELSYTEEMIENIEREIFKGHEKKVVFDISELSRHLLDLKKSVTPYRDVFHTLEQGGEKIYGSEFGFYVRGIIEEFLRIESSLRNQMETLTALRETNDALLSVKQNQTTKLLAIIALATDIIVGGLLIYLSIK